MNLHKWMESPWEIVEEVDVTDFYKSWYVSILEKINLSKDDLLSKGYSDIMD